MFWSKRKTVAIKEKATVTSSWPGCQNNWDQSQRKTGCVASGVEPFWWTMKQQHNWTSPKNQNQISRTTSGVLAIVTSIRVNTAARRRQMSAYFNSCFLPHNCATATILEAEVLLRNQCMGSRYSTWEQISEHTWLWIKGGGLIIAADGALHLYIWTLEHFTFAHFHICTL